MVWMESSTVSLRQEFVMLADKEGVNMRALCSRFGISPKTGYKWLTRFREAAQDTAALHDRSRRPHRSPALSPEHVQREVVAVRQEHPSWGGLKRAAIFASLAVR